MRITKAVFNTIDQSISDHPPETGGILGSRASHLIDEVMMDLPSSGQARPCSYAPNVVFLNRSIEAWQNSGITFMGLFHTHFFGVKTLSPGDHAYIRAIMDAMPSNVISLYFPIFVLPERTLICYQAIRTDQAIEIQQAKLQIDD